MATATMSPKIEKLLDEILSKFIGQESGTARQRCSRPSSKTHDRLPASKSSQKK
jgi:hypothetical protein